MTTIATASVPRTYPAEIALDDGRRATLRPLTEADRDAVLHFARQLPEDDLLFLRVDLTDPAVVEQWLARQAAGRSVALFAELGGAMAGYASLHLSETSWQRHVGEIRVQVGRIHRGVGLGRALATEVFAVARDLGLRKLVAQMTADQPSARATFQQLGFQPEALLRDFVIDRSDRTRDLVMMFYDLDGLTDRV